MPLLKLDSISRVTYYEWRKGNCELKTNTIKKIDDLFLALAGDIVANEGKGIFYAKNKLGWTDKLQTENTNVSILNVDPIDKAMD